MADSRHENRRRVLQGSLLAAATGIADLGSASAQDASGASGASGTSVAGKPATRRGRSWQIAAPYGIDSLRQVAVPVADPDADQVLIRVHATALNARDRTTKQGRFRQKTVPPGCVPLSDNAGVVVAEGSDVRRIQPGNRVVCIHCPAWDDGRWHLSKADLDLGSSANGFLQDYALVPASGVAQMPDSLSFSEACTLPVAGVTAWHALRGSCSSTWLGAWARLRRCRR